MTNQKDKLNKSGGGQRGGYPCRLRLGALPSRGVASHQTGGAVGGGRSRREVGVDNRSRVEHDVADALDRADDLQDDVAEVREVARRTTGTRSVAS